MSNVLKAVSAFIPTAPVTTGVSIPNVGVLVVAQQQQGANVGVPSAPVTAMSAMMNHGQVQGQVQVQAQVQQQQAAVAPQGAPAAFVADNSPKLRILVKWPKSPVEGLLLEVAHNAGKQCVFIEGEDANTYVGIVQTTMARDAFKALFEPMGKYDQLHQGKNVYDGKKDALWNGDIPKQVLGMRAAMNDMVASATEEDYKLVEDQYRYDADKNLVYPVSIDDLIKDEELSRDAEVEATHEEVIVISADSTGHSFLIMELREIGVCGLTDKKGGKYAPLKRGEYRVLKLSGANKLKAADVCKQLNTMA